MDVAATLQGLAAVLATAERFKTARSAASRAAQILSLLHGPRHLLVSDAYQQLALIHEGSGDLAAARDAYSYCLAIRMP